MDIKKNQIYEVDILDNGFKGEGIAKIDNFTVFVPNAIKGEKVKIKILKVLTSHAFAKIEEILESSSNRKDDDCDIYFKCGGCAMRHMDYKTTLDIKKESVISTLKKQGINVQVNDVIGMENPLFYRNKLQYPLGKDLDGKPVMGIFAERTHRIVPTEKCYIQNEKLQEVANGIFDFINENKIRVYDEEKLSGEIRHLVLKIGVKTNEIMVVIVSNKRKITKEKELIDFISKRFPNVKTIVKNINPFATNVILGNENVVLYGDGYIYDELLGFKFKISPMSFYQVNPYQTEKLYSKAIECAELSGNETVFDLYCGIGTIGICASKGVKKLYGIETIPEAIEDAKRNAELNGIENAEFFVGDVEKSLPEFIEKNDINADVIFIDPPRKGCDRKAIETILRIKPKRIVYISCNPATLARDLKMFEEVYTIGEVTPVDMFPYTGHVETISVLELK
ncbi:MAG: 23S rRNA (uracil(1939)-C(5))-methyltransferase RlmD [Clostridia bacterium]|jgi:23S rRNA (uracil1939-C5)-methyltransferase|nr:23S rRNA (uracil(1939)-C(5))-methyltransferase RlmD [Clostridia bacterium]